MNIWGQRFIGLITATGCGFGMIWAIDRLYGQIQTAFSDPTFNNVLGAILMTCVLGPGALSLLFGVWASLGLAVLTKKINF